MSINKIILISLLINLFIAQDSSQNHPDYYDELYCGKKNPKTREIQIISRDNNRNKR